MNTPQPFRLQRTRKKGQGYIWPGKRNIKKGFSIFQSNNLPIVYVGRPSKWGNPLKLTLYTRAKAVELFEKHLTDRAKQMIKTELRGKNLCCWCPLDQPCHADILLEIANS